VAQEVRDISSNENDVVVMAARTIGKGERREVFREVYFGKKATKTAAELAEKLGMTRKRITEHGKVLERRHLIQQLKSDDGVAYGKVKEIAALRDRILRATENPDAIPTKVRPKLQGGSQDTVMLRIKRTNGAQVLPIYVDDVDTFENVRNIPLGNSMPRSVTEMKFKEGLQAIVGQAGKFKDWGGEYCDLYTSRLVVGGLRVTTAFALKGPGEPGKLVPGKMGKNGDQIQRMFQLDANIFFVQHWREIDHSVLTEMRAHAINKSHERGGQLVRYGVIDGQDSERLRQAYPAAFGVAS
jgi:hypothetical protein